MIQSNRNFKFDMPAVEGLHFHLQVNSLSIKQSISQHIPRGKVGVGYIKEKMIKNVYFFSESQMNKKVRAANGTFLCLAFFFLL